MVAPLRAGPGRDARRPLRRRRRAFRRSRRRRTRLRGAVRSRASSTTSAIAGRAAASCWCVPPISAAARESSRPALLDRRSADEIGILYTDAVLYGLGAASRSTPGRMPSSAGGGILPALALGGVAAGLRLLRRSPASRCATASRSRSRRACGSASRKGWPGRSGTRRVQPEPTTGRRTPWRPRCGDGDRRRGVWAALLGTVYGTTPGRASFMGSAALWTGLVSGLIGATALEKSRHRRRRLHAGERDRPQRRRGRAACSSARTSRRRSRACVSWISAGSPAGSSRVGSISRVADRHPDQRAATGVLAGRNHGRPVARMAPHVRNGA